MEKDVLDEWQIETGVLSTRDWNQLKEEGKTRVKFTFKDLESLVKFIKGKEAD